MRPRLQWEDGKRVRQFLKAAGFSYAGVCFFPELLPKGFDGFSHSVLHLAVFAILMTVYLKGSPFSISPYSYVLGGTYSFCLLAGKAISETGILPLRAWRFLGAWAVFSMLAAHGLEWGYRRISFVCLEKNGLDSRGLRISRKWIWAGIFLSWLPVWLALYPGAFAYDAEFAYEQIRTGELTSHHPVLHTLILGNAVRLGNLSGGGYNLGIAVYCLLQMAFVSFAFSYVTEWIGTLTEKPWTVCLTFAGGEHTAFVHPADRAVLFCRADCSDPILSDFILCASGDSYASICTKISGNLKMRFPLFQSICF